METRFKSLVEVVPKGEAAQCGMPQEKCDTACTGEASMSLAQNSPMVKGGLQRLLRVFGQNDFPLRRGGVPPNSTKEKIR